MIRRLFRIAARIGAAASFPAVGPALAIALAGAVAPSAAAAVTRAPRTVLVPALPGALGGAIGAAAAGDTLVLAAGVHPGPVRVDRRVVLRGRPGAVVDGGGRGTVLAVVCDGVTVQDLEVRGSGSRVLTVDSGIQVIRGVGVVIRRVRLQDVLYGVYGERCDGLVVEDCDFRGRVTPRPVDAGDGDGNGIHLWYCRDPRITRNTVRSFADGVYLSFVNGASIEANLLEQNGRYGLHTMYCQTNTLAGNRFQRNVAGCAIMFSNRLRVVGNDFWRNRGPRTYGLLLRDCSDGEFRENRLVDNTIAVFMDGSNRNRFHRNLLQDDGWGMFIFASSADNEIAGNSFVNCDYPVALDMRRTSNRFDDGRNGNYWSENAPYDLDGDGTSDVPYSPVGAFAFLSKQFPDLSVLAKSPAVAALGVAERVVPALRPSDAVDRHPRLAPIAVTGTGMPLRRSAPAAASWGAAFGFSSLLGLGLAGLAGARRRA
jgi:nitrous oxidase accessory protein